MEGLNFHHLRYFWTVARKGGVRKAAQSLHVSQPSISAQIRLLEEALGDTLFQRSGRHLVQTETGQLVMSYADESSTRRELMNAVRQGHGTRELCLNVGVIDSDSKLIAYEILKPVPLFASRARRLPSGRDRAAGVPPPDAPAGHRTGRQTGIEQFHRK